MDHSTGKMMALMLALGCFAITGSVPALLTAQEKKAEETLTITGVVKCSSCDLKKGKGAASQCSIHGCQFAFLTEKVSDPAGKRLKKFEGKLFHILLNDHSKELAHKEHKGKKYELKGKIYDAERVVEIGSFSPVK